LAFKQVRAEIRIGRDGTIRADIWVNALLNDGDDDDARSIPDVSNVISLSQAREDLTRCLVSMIDHRHRMWRRYPVLRNLAQSSFTGPEALADAYLRFLRRDLEALCGHRAGPRGSPGSTDVPAIDEGHSEGC
jgi:hypothetical protein